jgi:hypothetical protein
MKQISAYPAIFTLSGLKSVLRSTPLFMRSLNKDDEPLFERALAIRENDY